MITKSYWHTVARTPGKLGFWFILPTFALLVFSQRPHVVLDPVVTLAVFGGVTDFDEHISTAVGSFLRRRDPGAVGVAAEHLEGDERRAKLLERGLTEPCEMLILEVLPAARHSDQCPSRCSAGQAWMDP